jgi:hypothetical protein
MNEAFVCDACFEAVEYTGSMKSDNTNISGDRFIHAYHYVDAAIC